MSKLTYDDFNNACTNCKEKYGIKKNMVYALLLGPNNMLEPNTTASTQKDGRGCYSDSTFRKGGKKWDTDEYQEYILRVMAYDDEPETIIKDLFAFLYGKKNLPNVIKNYNKGNSNTNDGFIKALKDFVKRYVDDDREYAPENTTPEEEEFRLLFTNIFFLFNRHFDERHGGLREEAAPFSRMLQAYNATMNERISNASSMANNITYLMQSTEPLSPEAKDIDDAVRNVVLEQKKIEEQLEEFTFFNKYIVSPEINRIVWQNVDIFSEILSQKLCSYYSWTKIGDMTKKSTQKADAAVSAIRKFYTNNSFV